MRLKGFVTLSFLICVLFCNILKAQSDFKVPSVGDAALADEYFSAANYIDALKNYLALLKKDPLNDKYNYKAGLCYLYSNINRSKSLTYLELAAKADKVDNDLWFYLGKAYHLNYKFDEAIKAFQKFKKSGKGLTENRKQIDLYIDYCNNAKALLKSPINVTFANLGKNVNSPAPEYQAFVPEDESFLVYTSRRKDAGVPLLPNGQYAESIYISKITAGDFAKSKPIGPPVNTGDGDVEVVGLSSTGDVMLLVYANEESFADLFIAYADKKMNFKKAEKLDKNINSSSQEIAAAISSDGNTLYFSSNRPGGFGGTDLYFSHKLPNGTWALAQNMGPNINTADDEDFPNISIDGQTFYFSSNGHNSMGGYDIFVANFDSTLGQWSGVKNFGYPINTPDDDMNLRLSANKKYGYISALRDGGLGDLDIYRVDFNAEEANSTLIKGVVASADTTVHFDPNEIRISVTNLQSNELYGIYTPNSSNHYVMILPPGKFSIHAEVPGFNDLNENIVIQSKIQNHPEIEKKLILMPKGGLKKAPLKKNSK